MNSSKKFTAFYLILALSLTAAIRPAHAQSAAATISDVSAGGGVFDYTIILQNTGSQDLNSFWYGWTQSGNNLPSNPSNAGNSLGWANNLDGNSIEWQNSTGTALTPGQSATFTFQSTSTLTEMTTSPAGESVAYVGTIDFSQNSPGDSTPVFSPAIAPVPEPSAVALASVPLLFGMFRALSRQKK